MGPTWGPSGADRTQVGPMLAPWTLLSGYWTSSLLACETHGNQLTSLYRSTIYASHDGTRVKYVVDIRKGHPIFTMLMKNIVDVLVLFKFILSTQIDFPYINSIKYRSMVILYNCLQVIYTLISNYNTPIHISGPTGITGWGQMNWSSSVRFVVGCVFRTKPSLQSLPLIIN